MEQTQIGGGSEEARRGNGEAGAEIRPVRKAEGTAAARSDAG